jgi:hypothetical protein
LQVIISQKKPGIAVNNLFLLCWHVESLAGSTASLKPHALRVPSCRRAGLDRIRSASSEGTCASKAKKAKGELLEIPCLGERGNKQKKNIKTGLSEKARYVLL